jgi:hypothetical protein
VRRIGEAAERDETVVGASFPTLRWKISKSRGVAHLEGPLLFTPECGVHGRVDIEVRFPGNYPRREPTTYDATA